MQNKCNQKDKKKDRHKHKGHAKKGDKGKEKYVKNLTVKEKAQDKRADISNDADEEKDTDEDKETDKAKKRGKDKKPHRGVLCVNDSRSKTSVVRLATRR